MRYISLEGTDPAFNHALEEYFLRRGGEYCLLWRNAPCILLGRNQDACAEVNVPEMERRRMTVVRRMTGGGAVYNDLGNLNFGRIADAPAGGVLPSFANFARPVIAMLRAMGLDARMTGRNDITVAGGKISGNAQARVGGRVLHHGTLLFSADMEALAAVLRSRPAKFEGRAVRSVAARVANIAGLLPRPMALAEFRRRLLEGLMAQDSAAELYKPTAAEREAIRRLAARKYATWEWNWGRSPAGAFRAERRLPGGVVAARFDVKGGCLHGLRLTGDFFGRREVAELERMLEGVPRRRAELIRRLAELPVEEYCAGISAEALGGLLLGAAPSDKTDKTEEESAPWCSASRTG